MIYLKDPRMQPLRGNSKNVQQHQQSNSGQTTYGEILSYLLALLISPAKGGGEDEDWATNATQVVSKGADQV
ncbi:hypothetical protein Tco_0749646 [Tanacetum coccineum]|uniref:Uncharacterized protein n=1 Tax=Tanacetum coccineum TaxID=301880 RepID=A0ABQ4Z014_9ASTR